MKIHGPDAASLLMGTVPLFLIAGVVEGSISQVYEPHLDYGLKIFFALGIGVLVYAWLLLPGRRRGPRPPVLAGPRVLLDEDERPVW